MWKNNTCSNVRHQIQKSYIIWLPETERLASNTRDCLANFSRLAATSALQLKGRKWGSLVRSGVFSK